MNYFDLTPISDRDWRKTHEFIEDYTNDSRLLYEDDKHIIIETTHSETYIQDIFADDNNDTIIQATSMTD